MKKLNTSELRVLSKEELVAVTGGEASAGSGIYEAGAGSGVYEAAQGSGVYEAGAGSGVYAKR